MRETAGEPLALQSRYCSLNLEIIDVFQARGKKQTLMSAAAIGTQRAGSSAPLTAWRGFTMRAVRSKLVSLASSQCD